MSNKKKMVKRNRIILLIVSIFFGQIALDRFIMKQWGLAILKLLTLGGLGIWYIIDIILIATGHEFKGVKWE